MRGDVNAVILRRGNVRIQKTQAFAAVTRDDAGNDNVARTARGETIRAVGLQPFAQRLRYRVAQARLKRLIVERQNFNGFFARDRAVDRPEMITGTTGQQQQSSWKQRGIGAGAFQLADVSRRGLRA